jgi:cephalosporin hydroxylase
LTASLLELADRETSDARTDKGNHGYLAIYEQILAPMRETYLPILELGVGQGGSLKMWREFFPNASIHGVEIRPVENLGPRITVHQGDTGDPDFLAEIGKIGPFALVIDDASHLGDHQELAFRTFWPRVAPGCIYAIEDLHAAYMKDFEPSVMPFLQKVVDSVNLNGEWNDVVAVQFYRKLFIAAKAC